MIGVIAGICAIVVGRGNLYNLFIARTSVVYQLFLDCTPGKGMDGTIFSLCLRGQLLPGIRVLALALVVRLLRRPSLLKCLHVALVHEVGKGIALAINDTKLVF
ncbi:unknown [Eggerthella sp. CAG:209]|nr:unknown [Eggerthella sp. CAG:209]